MHHHELTRRQREALVCCIVILLTVALALALTDTTPAGTARLFAR